MNSHANPIPTSAAASFLGAASPSLELLEARRLRDAIAALLRREQAAMADFLIALADFDRRRGWEVLGHASLFAFINSELGLSPAPTSWRVEAARLLQRFPDLVEPLRRGQLCLTTMGELAKVLTQQNRAAVLPRFLGISSREAKEIVAELQPRPAPPMRTVVRPLATARAAVVEFAALTGPNLATPLTHSRSPSPGVPADTDSGSLWAPKVELAAPARLAPRRDDVDPLRADVSRLSTTVSRRFLQKLKSARAGLGHAIPGATTEQVLEAALDLLLEKQAKARALVKRPRAVAAPAIPSAIAAFASDPAPDSALPPVQPVDEPNFANPLHRRTGPREAIPAAVRRAVWERDQGRCTWPLDAGGCCGSTHRLELDHVVPWARDGEPTEANLRLLCGRHNRLAAKSAFGERVMGRYASP
jgi:hypothetical protein